MNTSTASFHQFERAILTRSAKKSLELYCPFVSTLNPEVLTVQQGSLEWCVRFGLVPEDQMDKLGRSKIGWLVSRTFCDINAEFLQIASDWTHLFCLLDDRVEATSSVLVLSTLLDGLRRAFVQCEVPGELCDEPLAHALVDLSTRMSRHASLEWLKGFSDRMEELFTAFIWERVNAQSDISPDVASYVKMRRITVGLSPLFHIGALAYGEVIPQHYLDHAAIQRLQQAACNCVGWTNDLCTYEKELEQGERHNLVLVVMRQNSLSAHAAALQAAQMHDEEIAAFLQVELHLPDFGPYHRAVRRYVGMLRSWMRGHLDWAQETGRYRPLTQERMSHLTTWAVCSDATLPSE